MAKQLVRTATGYRVWVSRLTGVARPPTPLDYAPWAESAALLPGPVIERMAPGVTTAKCELNIAALNIMPWSWRDYIRLDDRIAIVDAAGTECIFCGFVTDVDWETGQASASATVTAAANAIRLRRDADRIVWGRVMPLSDGSGRQVFTGWAAEFNAGGNPNRAADAEVLAEEAAPEAPARGIYDFTADDAAGAAWWTWSQAAEYVMFHGNPGPVAGQWIRNHLFDPGRYAESVAYNQTEPITVDVEGMSCWEALAAVADAGGWDVWERFTLDAGVPGSTIRMQRRHTGNRVTVKRQDRTPAGSLVPLNLNETNLFATQVAESVTDCLTAPIVVGARPLIEITVPLQPAWDPADIAEPGGGEWAIEQPGYEIIIGDDPAANSTWVRRYHAEGDQHLFYSDVGRLFVANEDGAYSDAPYSLDLADLADLAGEDAGTWPAVPFVGLPCVTRAGGQGSGSDASAEAVLEITFNADEADPNDVVWQRASGFDVLDDRLGVRLTDPNPSNYFPGQDDTGYWEADRNLFYLLAEDPGKIGLRLTVTVAHPLRSTAQAARTSAAGTAFDTGELVDRRAAGAVRSRSAGSSLSGDADTCDQSADLAAAAAAIQAAHEGRNVEAGLPIEWPDEDIELGDTVAEIGGIGVDLSIDDGRAPRVVQLVRLLTPETWSMQITLGTDRKAAVT